MDGQILITETKNLVTLFILCLSGCIIYAQKNNNLVVYLAPATSSTPEKSYKNRRGNQGESRSEVYIILLTNLFGVFFLIYSNDWILTIISWELFNLTQYLLVSLRSDSESGLAASLKYFVLSALSTGFLLLGVCILYQKTGSLNYEIIETSIRELSILTNSNTTKKQIEIAKVLIVVTQLFKLSAAPFYQWAPDLYENLETKITMWMIIIPKLAVLSFFFILISATPMLLEFSSISFLLQITGSLSLIIGSIGLYNQWLIKRFLAYSGISHVGFLLLSLYCQDLQSYLIYMIIYGITTFNIFLILILFSQSKNLGRDQKLIQDLSGLFRNHPALSLAFALNLFSLAGVCPL